MSGQIGIAKFSTLPSGQTGEAYVALKRPLSMVQWKDGYPVVGFHTARGAGAHVFEVGHIPFGTIWRDKEHPGQFKWRWATNEQLYPVTASGEALTLAYAKDQVRQVIREICGTPRP